MSREVRKVPADWQHPADGYYPDGEVRYVPLFDGRHFAADAANWDARAAAWELNEKAESDAQSFEEWDGPRPDPKDYMPRWQEDLCTHFMMYSTTTEGAPCSPAFATAEELASWLVDNKVSIFAGQTADFDTWMQICNGHEVVIPLSGRVLVCS